MKRVKNESCQIQNYFPEYKQFPIYFLKLLKKKLRDRILNILSFLSESLLKNKDLFYDGQEIWDSLSSQGYSEGDIEATLAHIERMSLQVPGPFWSEIIPVHRAFSPEEMTRLSPRVRGYLWKLKCRGIIDHVLEDEIVQKAMNLEDPAGLREIKTVAALTVFGYEHRVQPGQDGQPISGTDLH